MSKKLTKSMKSNNIDVVSVFSQFINAKKEYEQTKEQEITKRLEIEADLRKHIETVVNQREFLEKYLEKEYKIRQLTIDKFFEVLDNVLENNKDNIVIKTLESIENVVKETPLSGLMQLKKSIENNEVIKI